jgi:hypothetical protein
MNDRDYGDGYYDDEVQAFIDAMARRRAERLNPLASPAAAAPVMPEPMGDPVTDFLARIDALAATTPSPLRPRQRRPPRDE